MPTSKSQPKRNAQRKQGSLWKSAHFVLWVSLKGPKEKPTEWKIAVSKKLVRLATDRNRWKRRIREVLRKSQEQIRPGFETTLRVADASTPVKGERLKNEILGLLTKADLVSGDSIYA